MREGYLHEDIDEMRTTKRIYWRKCYRIVDAEGKDMIVPWMLTKKEARATAKALNIKLVEH